MTKVIEQSKMDAYEDIKREAEALAKRTLEEVVHGREYYSYDTEIKLKHDGVLICYEMAKLSRLDHAHRYHWGAGVFRNEFEAMRLIDDPFHKTTVITVLPHTESFKELVDYLSGGGFDGLKEWRARPKPKMPKLGPSVNWWLTGGLMAWLTLLAFFIFGL